MARSENKPNRNRLVGPRGKNKRRSSANGRMDDPFDKWRSSVGGFPGGLKEINAWVRAIRGRDDLPEEPQ